MTDRTTVPSGGLDVAIRLLDPRLTGWGFPRWGSALAAGLDLHACLDGETVIAPQAPAILIPAGFALAIRDPPGARWCIRAPASGIGTGWCSATPSG